MNKQRVYLDTSVFGGYYDPEFEEFTIPFFNRIYKGEFTILFSAVLQRELEPAPKRIIGLVQDFDNEYMVILNEDKEALDLAMEYIREKVVGQTSFADCLHIALATINRADLLVSWNFKHIVNIERIRGYNSVNIKTDIKIWRYALQEI